jgi:glycosyltransferase involved in cell wall biosynthesis
LDISIPILSIVVPCYNEEEVIGETTSQLIKVLQRLIDAKKISTESRIYFVDDGSRDNTWLLINEASIANPSIVGVKLSRNRGHQNALLAGLFYANGDAVISVDADLQDDLDAIDKMLDAFGKGAQIVYGVRRRRDTDTWFKRFTAEGFYRLIAAMGAETIHNHADYRLLSRSAIENLKKFEEVNLFLRGIVPLVGFSSAIVEYDRRARFAGESKYPLKKMLALSLNAITSFSVLPLRLISIFGLLVSAASLVVTIWALCAALFSKAAVPGWASTVLPIYFLGGIQLLAIGIIGEYTGKIYMEVKRRPRYIIEKVTPHPGGHNQSSVVSGDLPGTGR